MKKISLGLLVFAFVLFGTLGVTQAQASTTASATTTVKTHKTHKTHKKHKKHAKKVHKTVVKKTTSTTK